MFLTADLSEVRALPERRAREASSVAGVLVNWFLPRKVCQQLRECLHWHDPDAIDQPGFVHVHLGYIHGLDATLFRKGDHGQHAVRMAHGTVERKLSEKRR